MLCFDNVCSERSLAPRRRYNSSVGIFGFVVEGRSDEELRGQDTCRQSTLFEISIKCSHSRSFLVVFPKFHVRIKKE